MRWYRSAGRAFHALPALSLVHSPCRQFEPAPRSVAEPLVVTNYLIERLRAAFLMSWATASGCET